jgi:hypothetical protein
MEVLHKPTNPFSVEAMNSSCANVLSSSVTSTTGDPRRTRRGTKRGHAQGGRNSRSYVIIDDDDSADDDNAHVNVTIGPCRHWMNAVKGLLPDFMLKSFASAEQRRARRMSYRSELISILIALWQHAFMSQERDISDDTLMPAVTKLAHQLADIFSLHYPFLTLSRDDVYDLIAASGNPGMFALLKVIMANGMHHDGSVDTPLREPAHGPSFVATLLDSMCVHEGRFPAGTLLPPLQHLMQAGFHAHLLPAHVCVIMHAHPDALQYLLEHGLDPNSTAVVHDVGAHRTHLSAFHVALDWAMGVPWVYFSDRNVAWRVLAMLIKHRASTEIFTRPAKTTGLPQHVPAAIYVFLGPLACDELADWGTEEHSRPPHVTVRGNVHALKNLLDIMPHEDLDATFMGKTLMQLATMYGCGPSPDPAVVTQVAALVEETRCKQARWAAREGWLASTVTVSATATATSTATTITT